MPFDFQHLLHALRSTLRNRRGTARFVRQASLAFATLYALALALSLALEADPHAELAVNAGLFLIPAALCQLSISLGR